MVKHLELHPCSHSTFHLLLPQFPRLKYYYPISALQTISIQPQKPEEIILKQKPIKVHHRKKEHAWAQNVMNNNLVYR